MKSSLFQAFRLISLLALSMSLTSCDVLLADLDGYGGTYYHRGQNYTGGHYETGTFYHQGRSYTNRYHHNGQYYYGGRYQSYTSSPSSYSSSRSNYSSSRPSYNSSQRDGYSSSPRDGYYGRSNHNSGSYQQSHWQRQQGDNNQGSQYTREGRDWNRGENSNSEHHHHHHRDRDGDDDNNGSNSSSRSGESSWERTRREIDARN